MSNEFKDKSFDGSIELLRLLVKIVNISDGNEIGVTLNVSGSIVSGLMVGMKHYYEKIGDMMAENAVDTTKEDDPTDLKRSLKEFFSSLGQQPDKPDRERQFNYIFLRAAKIYSGERIYPETSSVYWIGKVESVDGFFLGTLHVP